MDNHSTDPDPGRPNRRTPQDDLAAGFAALCRALVAYSSALAAVEPGHAQYVQRVAIATKRLHADVADAERLGGLGERP